MTIIPVRPMRDQFLTPDGLSYFDAAHMGLLPKRCRQAGLDGIERRAMPWKASGAETIAEVLRHSFGALLSASPETIALVPSASYGMALATRLFPPRTGTILVLEDEHPSQIMAWRRAAAHSEAVLRVVERPRRGDWAGAILSAIDSSVSIACLPQCHWLDGAPVDLVAVSEALRSVGAKLVVDATQSAGAKRFDVGAIRPDLVAVSGYKWLMGPMGVGYVYVAQDHHHLSPIEDGFGPRQPMAGWFDSAGHVVYPDQWKDGARKFDAAGLNNPIQLDMARESLKLIGEIGVSTIETELCRRNAALLAAHPNAPFLRHSETTHILSLWTETPERVRQAMDETRVSASLRGPYLRLSGHLWNDEEDAARVSDLLRTLFG